VVTSEYVDVDVAFVEEDETAWSMPSSTSLRARSAAMSWR
jgi:hypothetical protein